MGNHAIGQDGPGSVRRFADLAVVNGLSNRRGHRRVRQWPADVVTLLLGQGLQGLPHVAAGEHVKRHGPYPFDEITPVGHDQGGRESWQAGRLPARRPVQQDRRIAGVIRPGDDCEIPVADPVLDEFRGLLIRGVFRVARLPRSREDR